MSIINEREWRNIMRKYVKEIPKIMKNDLSLNILFVGMALYFAVLGIFNGQYFQAVCMALCIVLYFAGAMAGSIKKYLPIVLSILFIPVLIAAGIQFLVQRTVSDGFLSFAAVIMLFSLAGFTNTTGTKCFSYALGVVGSVFIFCINQNSNGIIICVGTMIAAIMVLDATYTAVMKYVCAWFMQLLVLKMVGVIFFLKNIPMKEGVMQMLAENEILYIVLVVLGLASLLLKERRPRIKSDRDKKHIPSLKRWQTTTGITFAILFFWGILNMNDIFSMEIHEGTKVVTQALLYIYVYINNFAGSLDNILSQCGFIALSMTVALMCAFAYKALDNYRNKAAIEDKLLGLFMIGYIVSFFYLDFSVPMTLFSAFMAGCIANGSYSDAN